MRAEYTFFVTKVKGIVTAADTYQSILKNVNEKIKIHSGFILVPLSLNDLSQMHKHIAIAKMYKRVDLAVADGMPLVWWLRIITKRKIDRIYGPDLMRAILTDSETAKYRHVLYGSSPSTLTKLIRVIKNENKNSNIVGKISPSYFKEFDERESDLQQIKKLKPDVLWIGLSSPKQVVLATQWKKHLPDTAIFCVGAAFDFVSQNKKSAPVVMKKLGLEWLFRLITEPRRLYQRYLFDIPHFLGSELVHRFL